MVKNKAHDHYKAIHDLIGAEDIAHLKAFLNVAGCNLYHDDLTDTECQGMGLLIDIIGPEGIDENGSNV